jgi:hypothetical protein
MAKHPGAYPPVPVGEREIAEGGEEQDGDGIA